MKILRAHDPDIVAHTQQILLDKVPAGWLREAQRFQWLILPDDLRPSWIGLQLNPNEKTHDGRSFDTCGGWCASEVHKSTTRWTPHIYLNHSSIRACVHEVGHALAVVWKVNLKSFFKPDNAFYGYMASNPDEYFACALEAFLTDARHDRLWNCDDLAEKDKELYSFLDSKRRSTIREDSALIRL